MILTKIQSSETLQWILGAIMAITIIGGVTYGIYLLQKRWETVASSKPVGEAISAVFISGTFDERTKVETSRGYYLIHGTFQITKGEQLELQIRNSGYRHLCITGTNYCKQLVE